MHRLHETGEQHINISRVDTDICLYIQMTKQPVQALKFAECHLVFVVLPPHSKDSL